MSNANDIFFMDLESKQKDVLGESSFSNFKTNSPFKKLRKAELRFKLLYA